jgi:hypothetical protein
MAIDPELDLRRSFIVWKNDHRAAIAGHSRLSLLV